MPTERFFAILPFLISAATSYAIAIYCVRRRTVPGAGYYAIVAFCWGLMTTGYIVELLASTLPGKIFWDDLQFYPSLIFPVAFLAFSFRFTEHHVQHPRLIWGVLLAIAVSFSVIVLTNNIHHGMRDTAGLAPGKPFSALAYDYTPLALAYTFYVYAVFVWAIIVLALKWFRLSGPYRGQISTILIGHILPYTATFLTLFGVIPVFERDTSPFWFAISNVVVWWGLYHYRLFDLAPLARETLIEQMGDIVVVLDAEDRVVDVNRTAQTVSGRPANELIGRPVVEAFPQARPYISRLTSVDRVDTELEVVGAEGARTIFDLKVTPFYDQQKKLIGRLIVARDITQLKQTQAELTAQRAQLEKAVARRTSQLTRANRKLKQEIAEREQIALELRESDERLKRLADAAFEGIAISENGMFVEANQQMADMLAVDLEDLIGQPIVNFVAPESRSEVARRIKTGDESSYEHIAMKKDGAKFPVEVRVRTITVNGQTLRVSAVRDITDQRAAEQLIKDSEERLRMVLDNMPILLDAFDEDGNIIVWNKACEEVTGYSAEEIISNPRAMELLYPDPKYRAMVWEASMDLNNYETTFDLTTKSGERRTVMWFEIFRRLHVPGWAAWGLGVDITEQKRAEKAIKDSEARFRAIVEDQTEFVVRWKPDGTRTFANDAYCRYFGQTYDQIIGTSFFPLIVPEDLQKVRDRLAALTRQNPVSTDVHQVIRPDGTISWQEWTDRAIFDEDGQLIEMQSVGRDISERKYAEEAEREQRELAEALRDTTTALSSKLSQEEVLNSILDNLGRVLPHDAANVMLIDGDVARVVGKRGYDRWNLNDTLGRMRFQVNEHTNLKKMIDTGQSVVIPDTHQDLDWGKVPGFEWIRSYAGAPIQAGDEIIGFLNLDSATVDFFDYSRIERLSAFADQAALALHNARLYETERRERILAQMFQHLAEGVHEATTPSSILKTVLEALGRLIPYHKAVIGLLEETGLYIEVAEGFTSGQDIIGRLYLFTENPRLLQILSQGQPAYLLKDDCPDDWAGLPGVDAEAAVWVAMPLTTWDVTTGLLCLTLTDASLRSEDVIGALVTFSQRARLALENSRLLVELLHSKGDLREAKSYLVRSAELAIAGEIATGVAHQISNPLTSVMAHAYLLLQKVAPDDPLYEYGRAIKDATDRAATVVQRMLDFARAREYDMQPVDVNKSLTTAASLVEPQITPHARLVVNLAPDLPQIIGSREHLEDVWINLLINARDALRRQDNGMITLTSALEAGGKSVVVTLQDNGPGIPLDAQGRIFSSFFTTKEGGVGLGLAICYEIIAQHHGSIHVESREGGGAKFIVRLPVGSIPSD